MPAEAGVRAVGSLFGALHDDLSMFFNIMLLKNIGSYVFAQVNIYGCEKIITVFKYHQSEHPIT